jgi:XapX domain-containing protein
MKPYVVSLAAGFLIGILYGLLGVRSPAPPLVALAGLLGILLGERVVPIASQCLHFPDGCPGAEAARGRVAAG